MFVTTHFDLHGRALRVHGPTDLLEIVARRLAPFRVAGDVTVGRPTIAGAGPLSIEYVLGDEPHDPAGGREVCSSDPHPTLRGEVARYWYHPDSDLLAIEVGGRRRLLVDAPTGTARIYLPNDYPTCQRLYTHMLVTVALVEMLRRRGLLAIHAASVEVAPGVGALIYGASGAGKSTLAVTLMRSGLPYQGDDMVLLEEGENGLDALAFPDEVDLTDASVERIPGLSVGGLRRYTGGHKWAVRPEDLASAPLATRLQPRLLVIPRVAHAPTTTLTPLSAGEALVRLVPTLLATERETHRAGMAALARLTQQCRCVRMDTGTDLFDMTSVPRMLRELAGSGSRTRRRAPGAAGAAA